jgi:hypothetical protein
MADEECVSACLRAEQLRWKRREEEEEEEEVERSNEDGLKKGEKSARERGKVKSEKSTQLKNEFQLSLTYHKVKY